MRVALRDFTDPRDTREPRGTHAVDAIRARRLDEGPALAVADRSSFRPVLPSWDFEVISTNPAPKVTYKSDRC